MGGARNLKLGKCLFTVRSNDVFVYAKCRPVERVGLGVSYHGPRDVWGPRLRSRILKYTSMRHLKKIKHFLPRWAPRKCFPGPAVVLDQPGHMLCASCCVHQKDVTEFMGQSPWSGGLGTKL